MTGGERLDEDPSGATCLTDSDCHRYALCQLAHGCRCQVWGECVLVRVAGQPCHSSSQCAVGLVCGDGSSRARSRCVPSTHLEDLPRFADLPEPDVGTHPDIPATYGGPLLVASISISLVILCLILAAWCRLTAPTNLHQFQPRSDADLNSSSSVLIGMNHIQPCYSSTHMFVQPHHSKEHQ
ncbi:uncharacterized protein LOC128998944 [Macrosteles quadrilineatus]|uniref:uncharacterized protein LOC128998944 n=1 Tax=Macrosteles quadrilineatus TaxID=74068 RepID=UPI0023E28664|nr:uncharacterized protein LOC128998944 [Macrosteles quadrilineatus]